MMCLNKLDYDCLINNECLFIICLCLWSFLFVCLRMFALVRLRHVVREIGRPSVVRPAVEHRSANLPTNIVDFRGFDSSIISILRGGMPRPIGDFPESLSQAILVVVMLVGRMCLI